MVLSRVALAWGCTHREAHRRLSASPAEIGLFARHFRRLPTMQALFVRYACAALSVDKRRLHPHEFSPEMYDAPRVQVQGRTKGGLPKGGFIPGFMRRGLDSLQRRRTED